MRRCPMAHQRTSSQPESRQDPDLSVSVCSSVCARFHADQVADVLWQSIALMSTRKSIVRRLLLSIF